MKQTHIVFLSSLMLLGLVLSSSVNAKTVEAFLEDAQRYIDNKEYRAGIIQLKNALKEDAEFGAARLLLGKTYLTMGDGASAEKELRRARQLGVAPEQWMVALGEAYLLQRNKDKTNALLAEIKSKDGFRKVLQGEVMVLRAEAYVQVKDEKQAKEHFEKSLTLAPQSPRVLLGNARYAAVFKQYDKANQYLDDALKINAKHAEVWTLKANIASANNNPTRALRAFNHALDANPNYLPAQLGRVTVQVALREFAMAKTQLEPLKKTIPNHPSVNYFDAVLNFEARDMEATETSLNKVFRVVPDHPASLLIMGSVQYAKKQYEQAEHFLDRFVSRAPTHLPAVKLLAATRLKNREPQKAIDVLLKVEKQATTDAQLLSLLGTAYTQTGNASKGSSYFEKAAEIAPDVAAIRTQLGLSYMAEGNLDQAVTTLETAIELGPDVVRADMLLVLAHLKKKEFDDALKAAGNLAKKQPENPLPYNFMGAAYLGKGDKKQARVNFEKALAIQPDYTGAMMNLAQLTLQEQKIDEARELFNKIIESAPGHVGASMVLARMASQSGNETEMVKYLESTQEHHPTAIQPNVALAKYHIKKQNPLRGVAILKKLHESHPKHFVVLENLGAAQLATKQTASAIRIFEEMVEYYPKVAKAYFLLGRAQSIAGDKKEARQQFTKAVELDDKLLLAHLGIIDLDFKEKKYKKVLIKGKELVEQFPNNPAGWIVQGDVHLKQSQAKKAVVAYESAYKKGKNTALVLKYALALVMNGDQETSETIREDWLKEHANDLRVKISLAQYYQETKQDLKAIAQYESVIKQQPKNVMALNNLAWIYTERKDKKALEYGETAFELAPDNPAITDTLGWALTNVGDIKRGLVLLQQASMQAPHLAEIKYHLSVALHKNGKRAEAVKELQRLLRSNKDFPEIGAAKTLLAELRK